MTTTNTPKLTVSVDLDAPIEHCFEVAYVDTEMMHWVPNPKSVVYDHSGASEPYGPGSERLVTLKSGQSLVEKIIVSDKPTKIIYGIDTFGKILDKIVNNYQGHMDFEALDAHRTRLHWSVYYDLQGAGKLMAPMFKIAYKVLIGHMAKNIKKYLAKS
jgi:Polyketide cyclase / dehydrase and lipid transport